MKKIALLLALLMLLSCLTACGGEENKNDGTAPVATGEAGEQTDATGGIQGLLENCHASDDGKHQYEEELISEATCTEAGLVMLTCIACQESTTMELPALGHQGTGASCEEPSICTACGELAEAPWGHDPEGGICKNCGIDVISETQQPTTPETTEPETTEPETTEQETTEQETTEQETTEPETTEAASAE